MKFIEHFRIFLRDTVNLNQSRLDTLEGHVEAIKSHLCSHEELSKLIIKTVPQGSWAHLTIIKPLEGREFDADVLLELHEQSEWSPKDYLCNLRAALIDSDRYKDKTTLKNRCVRVQYAGDCHVDLVPFIRADGVGNIVNRADNKFEATNPEGVTAWFDDQNQLAGGELRRVTRLVKYLRDIKGTFTAKSIILTTLLAARVNPATTDAYADTPTALRSLMTALANYLDGYPETPPSVPDPSTRGATFDHRWPNDKTVYQNFRRKVRDYANKIDSAYSEPDSAKSMNLWQEIFGEAFGYDPKRAVLAGVTTANALPCSENEQFITDPEFGVSMPQTLKHRVRVSCRVLPMRGFRDGELSRIGHVDRGRILEFSVANCTAPKPYLVYWKIKNTGQEAASTKCLRGDIHCVPTRNESTLYRGQHWVECYIVKDGTCVARLKYPVRIR